MERLVNEDLLCQICFERKRDTLIGPCKHMLYCRKCLLEYWAKSERKKDCPACRSGVTVSYTSPFVNS
jgi:hypothetical protein